MDYWQAILQEPLKKHTSSDNKGAKKDQTSQKGDDSKDDTESDGSTDITADFADVTLKDGTYEGSAEGYKSEIKVSVTVKDGKVAEHHHEGPGNGKGSRDGRGKGKGPGKGFGKDSDSWHQLILIITY